MAPVQTSAFSGATGTLFYRLWLPKVQTFFSSEIPYSAETDHQSHTIYEPKRNKSCSKDFKFLLKKIFMFLGTRMQQQRSVKELAQLLCLHHHSSGCLLLLIQMKSSPIGLLGLGFHCTFFKEAVMLVKFNWRVAGGRYSRNPHLTVIKQTVPLCLSFLHSKWKHGTDNADEKQHQADTMMGHMQCLVDTIDISTLWWLE